jgi:hypothetical protein
MLKPGTWVLCVMACAIGAGESLADPNPFAHFEHLAHRMCPGRKLAGLLSSDWQEIMLEGKGLVFSASAERRLKQPSSHFTVVLNCAANMTVNCDVGARMYAIQSQGLMKDTVRQICRKWRCQDEATCTYSPNS